MGFTSLQVCMDSAEWLQGTIHDESGLDSSTLSSPTEGGDHMLTCSRPLIERRLRPPHDQALKCPRCESTHTKFCYYNNYSLSQPRYFCKTCRRYWTKGGTLRNIPVGGGCRKNKKVSKKSSSSSNDTNSNNQLSTYTNTHSPIPSPLSHNMSIPTDLHLSFPDQIHYSHVNYLLATQGTSLLNQGAGTSFSMMDQIQSPRPIDFMENKLEGVLGATRNVHDSTNNFDFIGSNNIGHQELGLISNVGVIGDHHNGLLAQNFHGFNTSQFGISLDGNTSNAFIDNCQRLMLPHDHHHQEHSVGIDVKPTINAKLLSLEWQQQQQDQACPNNDKESFGYLNNVGPSWTTQGMINNYGS